MEENFFSLSLGGKDEMQNDGGESDDKDLRLISDA